MMERMDARQLRGWIAYAELEPFGDPRADLRAGIVAATVANVHRGRRAAYKPADFMPRFRAQQQTPEQMASILMAAALAAKGAKR